MEQNDPYPHIIRVLLADDHRIVRAGIRQFLEQTDDIRVIVEASDGREACDQILKNSPDVAVLDIQMPNRNGIETARWIRDHHLPVGIMILTAYDDEPYIRAVLRAGANGYVLKTAEPHEIIEAIRNVYHGKNVLEAILASKLSRKMGQDANHLPVNPLTEREQTVLTLTARGDTNKAIGVQLGISDRTVQNHLANIFQKLNAESRTQAVMRAVSMGYISVDVDMKAGE